MKQGSSSFLLQNNMCEVLPAAFSAALVGSKQHGLNSGIWQ